MRTRIGIVVSIGAIALAACGGETSATSSTDSSSTTSIGGQATSTTSASAFPVTVDHHLGTTVIETEPQRIVTVGLTDQDVLFALGVVPVAAQPWYEEIVVYPWAEEALPEIKTAVLPAGELNIEAVVGFEPDLIVATTTEVDENQYRLLSDIAPAIGPPADYDPYTMPWQEQTRLIGRAVGMGDRAEQLVSDAEAQFSEVRDRHPEWEGAEAVLASQYLAGELLVYPTDNPASSFLTSLGFEIAPGLDEFMDDGYGVPALSSERLDLIDVDLVLWDGFPEALEEAGLFDLATFQELDATTEARMVFPEPPRVADALSFRNVLSLPWALSHLESQIELAIDGDPNTGPDVPGS